MIFCIDILFLFALLFCVLFFAIFCIMSINIYTCTQADLETLEGIGPKSAADIIAVRNEVLAGTRPKLTINHLAAVRLQYDTWQAFIDEGKLSITFHAAQDEEEAIQELALRFDLKDEPIAARQRLYLAKQDKLRN